MKLRHEDIEINKEKPFTNGKLGREKYAKILTTLVDNKNDGFVLAINSEWGTGKTVFVKMWKQHLENEGLKTLYFNAWENDFEEDILVALLSEFKELLKSAEPKINQSFKSIINKATPLVGKVALGFAKTQIKKVIGEDATGELIDTVTSVTAEQLEEQINDYSKRKDSIVDFKDSLCEFVKTSSPEKPLVFIIDELDRCRPNYAVAVLEKVKHLFSVPGIVFVLSIDKEQLGNAVRGVYGSDKIDADEYLRRFIDIEYSLPACNAEIFCFYLHEYFNIDEASLDKVSLSLIAKTLFQDKHITLRGLEKILVHVQLVFNAQKVHISATTIIFIIYLRQYHEVLYRQIKYTELSTEELLAALENIIMPYPRLNKNWAIVYSVADILYLSHNSRTVEEIFMNGKDDDKLLQITTSKLNNNNELSARLEDNYSKYKDDTDQYLRMNYLTDSIELFTPFITDER